MQTQISTIQTIRFTYHPIPLLPLWIIQLQYMQYYFAQQSISLACHHLSVLSGWGICIERQAGRTGHLLLLLFRCARHQKTCQGDPLPSPVIKLPCWPLQSIPVLVCCTGHCCVAPSYEKLLQRLRNDNAMGEGLAGKKVESRPKAAVGTCAWYTGNSFSLLGAWTIQDFRLRPCLLCVPPAKRCCCVCLCVCERERER